MSPAASLHEYGASPLDVTTEYDVAVYDRDNREHRVTVRVDATDTVYAQIRAVNVAKRQYRMMSPAADEPRRVVTSFADADMGPNPRKPASCKAKGCTALPSTLGCEYCAEHWAQRQRALVCVHQGCTTVTSGQGAGKLCRRHSNARNIGGNRHVGKPLTIRSSQ